MNRPGVWVRAIVCGFGFGIMGHLIGLSLWVVFLACFVSAWFPERWFWFDAKAAAAKRKAREERLRRVRAWSVGKVVRV
jgi:hypothetical protein